MLEKCQQLSNIWKSVRDLKMTQFRESCRTDAEKRLAEALKQKRLGFTHNQSIAGYEVDFWFPDYRLVIEVDGYTHLSEDQRLLDQRKEQTLIAKGMVVIRMSNQQIRENLPDCLREIELMIQKIKGFQRKNNINDQWKKTLKNCIIVEPKPTKPGKEPKTIEEFFLSMDDKTD
jgi:very-short-patch-repair endonuclease